MHAFFSIIGAFFAIIFIGSLIFNLFKFVIISGWKRLKTTIPICNSYWDKIGWYSLYRSHITNPMKAVNITTGECQCCGRTYIGTTDDEDYPLKKVEFMGNTKVLCKDCLQKLEAEFNQNKTCNDKRFSKTAESLRLLLSDSQRYFK